MATGSNDGSGLNLSNAPAGRTVSRIGDRMESSKQSQIRSKMKSYSNTPNPADIGSLGTTLYNPALTNVTKDPDALTEPALKEFFNSQFINSDTARRPRELVWHSCWDVYNGTYDWSSKAWWQ